LGCGKLPLARKATIAAPEMIINKHPQPVLMMLVCFLTGAPQDGQAAALLLTVPPHSRHFRIAIPDTFPSEKNKYLSCQRHAQRHGDERSFTA
jgi:hypothetical protein